MVSPVGCKIVAIPSRLLHMLSRRLRKETFASRTDNSKRMWCWHLQASVTLPLAKITPKDNLVSLPSTECPSHGRNFVLSPWMDVSVCHVRLLGIWLSRLLHLGSSGAG